MASSSWEISCAEHRAEQFLRRQPPRRMILLKIPPLTLQVAERLVEVAWLIQPDDPASPWWDHPKPGKSRMPSEQHAMMRSLTSETPYLFGWCCFEGIRLPRLRKNFSCVKTCIRTRVYRLQKNSILGPCFEGARLQPCRKSLKTNTSSRWALAPVVATVLVLLLLPQLQAQSPPTNWNEAARDLAPQIAVKVGSPSNVSLALKNTSPLSGSDVAEIRHTVEAQFNSSGLRIVKPDQSVADIQLTLSQNVQGWLWVAEIRHGNNSDAVLIPVFTRQAPPLSGVSSTLTLHKTFLWSQPNATQVLDVAVLVGGSNPTTLLGWDSSLVSLYHLQQLPLERDQAQAPVPPPPLPPQQPRPPFA